MEPMTKEQLRDSIQTLRARRGKLSVFDPTSLSTPPPKRGKCGSKASSRAALPELDFPFDDEEEATPSA